MSYSDFFTAINTTGYDRFMYLTMFVDSEDKVLMQKYQEKVYQHNTNIVKDPTFADAGFDLFCSQTPLQETNTFSKVDFGVKCSAGMVYVGTHMRNNVRIVNYSTGFYIYPRSSISKTNFRLANSVGIIDAGYRGSLIGAFDKISQDTSLILPYSRLVQICAPNLVPIYVNLVTDVALLGPTTFRGFGGFGSTGL